MKRLFALLLALVALFGGAISFAQEEAVVARLENYMTNLPKGYGLVRTDDLVPQLAERNIILLDVRETEAEFNVGHIEGSINVPIRELTDNLGLLPDLKAEIVVVCKGGARAALAMAGLQILGYEDVRVLAGGYDAWVGAELPVTTDYTAPQAGTAPTFDPVIFEAVDAYFNGLPQGYGLVSAKNLAAELAESDLLLIDVRDDKEVAKGYLEGAQHIWIEEFWARLDELPADKSTPIVVYCQSGYRGGIANVALNLLGYTNVRNLSGGVKGWLAAELPLVGAQLDISATFSSYIASLPETFNALRVPDLAAELASANPPLVVDVRTADEFAEGAIPGAISIPLPDLVKNLALLPDPNANIVIVCGSGHRSAVAMTALNLLGYKNAKSLLSGMTAWKGAGNELTTEVTPTEAGTAPTFDPQLLAAVDSFITSIPQGYYVVRPADLNTELIENPPALLLDVRTPGEYAQGRIEGAVSIPLSELPGRLAEIPADKTTAIVVYDNPTHRSSIALAMLKLLGYENVRVLGGGTGAWTKAELPLTQ